MKKQLICVALMALVTLSTHAQSRHHVVLISIDGLRPEMYLDSTWPSPNLRQLMKRGVYALHMKSVFPSYTYPSHSSMVTGAYPGTHQVCYNAAPGGNGAWYWTTSNIKARTIWDAAKDAGLKTAIVQWPVSVGAPVTWNIPEIWPVKDGDDRITATRENSTPGLVEEIERNATGPLTRDNMNESYFTFDENTGRMAAYVFSAHRPDLLALHFASVDGEEHDQGRNGDSVRLALATSDRAIGDILEAIERSGLKDSTDLVIVGDHGFSDFHQAIKPNIWLSNKGLFHDGPHWGVKFQPAGGSCFLYLEHPEDTSVLSRVRETLTQIPDSIKKMFRIVEKPELIKMGADRKAVMALAAFPGTIFGGGTSGAAVVAVNGGHHGYDPNQPEMYTGFIAAGPDIRPGGIIPELTVVDIAPLIMAILRLDFNSPDGRLIPGILKQR